MYAGLMLAEARMADVVFAATAIETYYLRIRRLTAALARTPFFKPLDDGKVFKAGPDFTLPHHSRLIAAMPDAYFDFPFDALVWAPGSGLHRLTESSQSPVGVDVTGSLVTLGRPWES